MPLYRAFLQCLGAVAILAVALACSKKSTATSTTSATISGKVSYLRVPLAKDADGVPTGLVDAGVAANLQTLPARGVIVRAYQQVTQTQPDGSTTPVWTFVTSTSTSAATDTAGQYSLSLPTGKVTMLEILSTFVGGSSKFINLVAEPGGINSTTPPLDRLAFGLRKAADGSAPAGNNAPGSMLSSNTTLDLTVGLNDVWWLVNPSYSLTNSVAPGVSSAVLETSVAGRTAGQGTGSRVLAIGDTIASFVNTYGNATAGPTLDLHYWPGRTEPQGSFVTYDPAVYPQAFDTYSNVFHTFGSIAAGPVNDDAWDEGVILPLLGRNALYASSIGAIRTFAVPLNPYFPLATALPNLIPDLALIEGLPDAMAANVLKSPYLADTKGTTLASPVKDIRDLSALDASQKSPYSAPAIRAFAWQVVLKANSLAAPGTQATWSTINPLTTARFFQYTASSTNGAVDGTARDIEPLNIFSQITRLKEAKATTDPVDLAAIFTDAALTPLGTPNGIPWPRPATGSYAVFASNWGTDPTGTLPVVALSMAKATQVNGVYPNLAPGEVAFSGFNLTADKRCIITADISPALAAGSQVDVDLPKMNRTFSFTGAGGSTPTVLLPLFGTAPVYHPVRVRLRNATAIQPDVVLTLKITPAF